TQAYWFAPTLLWLGSGPLGLKLLCWLGLMASIFLVLNLWPRGMTVVCMVCYLSFIAAAQDFASYQSDGMLLAAGFICLLFAALSTLVAELGLVSMLFLPRRFKILCFFIVTPFQISIILTANLAFLNYLVLSLGILLLDDRFLQAVWARSESLLAAIKLLPQS